MLFAALTVIGLDVLCTHASLLNEPKLSTASIPDGDWHIGCDEPGHCSYYQDHDKRSLKSTLNAMDAVEAPEPKTEDYQNDRAGIDTRCSLTGFDLVEKFDHDIKDWVHHYKCPAGTTCNNVLGSGACRAGNDYTIPGKNRLWTFVCPDVYKGPLPNAAHEKTCHFSNGMILNEYGLPKLLEPYLFGTTRCNPNGRAVQYLESDTWKDIYACTPQATCVESANHTGCKAGNPSTFPLKLTARSNHDDGDDGPPTRCDPHDKNQVQFFSKWYDEWLTFYACQHSDGCYDLDGRAVCHDVPQDLAPSIEPPFPQWRPSIEQSSDIESQMQTRCDPENSKLVQYLHPASQQWLRFYQCHVRCKLFPEFAACEEHKDKFVVPSPPASSFQKRDNSDATVRVPRQDPYNPDAPDFHTYNTRCNPNDLHEIQRHDGSGWVHHVNCNRFGSSCVDVDGMGTCTVSVGVFELFAANYTSVLHGEPISPLRAKTSCNNANTTEILKWSGDSWTPSGVCLPPYECFDFAGAADFALCAHSDPKSGKMWLPWPALARSTNNGKVTRCKDEWNLEEFKGNSWVPFRSCHGAFKCRNIEDGSNGGCAADNLYHVLAVGGVNAAVNDNSPTGRARLPKRDESGDGLLRNSERLTEEGETLIDEGNDLTTQSDALMESFFGPRETHPDFEDMFPMEGSASSSSLQAAKDPTSPDTSLIPPATGSMRRRDSAGLIDDSMYMHKQGQHLVEEGNKLVAHGKKLLKSIFGEKTDEYIRNITQSRQKAEAIGSSITIPLPGLPTKKVDIEDVKTEIGIHDSEERDEESETESE